MTSRTGTPSTELRDTWNNGSHLAKSVTLGKIGRTWKNRSHLEKWVKPGKIDHLQKWVHIEKWVTLGKKPKDVGHLEF